VEGTGEGIQLMAQKKPDHPGVNKNIQPSVVAILYIAIAYLLKWALPLPYAVPVPLRNAGFGLVVIGFFFGVAALYEFRKVRTTSNVHGSPKSLVTTGIYRFTRNPIYLGFLFMVVGLPLNANTYWGIIVSPFFVMTINKLVIEREEEYLGNKFPKEYVEYTLRVRRWL
jgi:protein-S-isoprenylcysteine O-methyltransferase Ste14